MTGGMIAGLVAMFIGTFLLAGSYSMYQQQKPRKVQLTLLGLGALSLAVGIWRLTQ